MELGDRDRVGEGDAEGSPRVEDLLYRTPSGDLGERAESGGVDADGGGVPRARPGERLDDAAERGEVETVPARCLGDRKPVEPRLDRSGEDLGGEPRVAVVGGRRGLVEVPRGERRGGAQDLAVDAAVSRHSRPPRGRCSGRRCAG